MKPKAFERQVLERVLTARRLGWLERRYDDGKKAGLDQQKFQKAVVRWQNAQRSFVVKCRNKGFTFDEIGRILDVSRQTVEEMYHRWNEVKVMPKRNTHQNVQVRRAGW